VTFNRAGAGGGTPTTPALTVASAAPSSAIWQAVFDGVSNVTARGGADRYKGAWIVSHRAHEIHSEIRAERGRRHLLHMAAGQSAELATELTALEGMNRAARDQKNLYLHPWVHGRSTGRQKTFWLKWTLAHAPRGSSRTEPYLPARLLESIW
jgi:hypothetical protein